MRYPLRDVMPMVAERQAQRYREMSPSEKLALADSLWDLAWDAARAGVRSRQPSLNEAAVAIKARELLNAPD